MKTHLVIASLLSLGVLFSTEAFAQLDERAPGIYAVVGDESIALPYISGSETNSGMSVGIVAVGKTKYSYKGVTSGLKASDTFVLVINPDKKSGVVTPKKFDCFTKTMTPNDMIFIALTTNQKKDRREYESGLIIGASGGSVGMGASTATQERASFEWEQISDNSFKITLTDLLPGEYGIVFRTSKLSSFLFTSLFGFTVPDPDKVD